MVADEVTPPRRFPGIGVARPAAGRPKPRPRRRRKRRARPATPGGGRPASHLPAQAPAATAARGRSCRAFLLAELRSSPLGSIQRVGSLAALRCGEGLALAELFRTRSPAAMPSDRPFKQRRSFCKSEAAPRPEREGGGGGGCDPVRALWLREAQELRPCNEGAGGGGGRLVVVVVVVVVCLCLCPCLVLSFLPRCSSLLPRRGRRSTRHGEGGVLIITFQGAPPLPPAFLPPFSSVRLWFIWP